MSNIDHATITMNNKIIIYLQNHSLCFECFVCCNRRMVKDWNGLHKIDQHKPNRPIEMTFQNKNCKKYILPFDVYM